MALVADKHELRSGTVAPFTLTMFEEATPGLFHFFGTRQGPQYGGSNGELGTVRAAAPQFSKVLSVRQVHGTEALILDHPVRVGEKFDAGWDAIVTNQQGLLVTVRTADCVPVMLASPHHRVVAAVHAGWRGAVQGIVPKTLEAMRARFGCTMDSIHMAIGPSAGPCCYEVDQAVIDPIQKICSNWQTVLNLTDMQRGQLDLKGFVRQQAVASGINPDHVHALGLCTICRGDLFFSYRREGKMHGTMVSGIMLP